MAAGDPPGSLSPAHGCRRTSRSTSPPHISPPRARGSRGAAHRAVGGSAASRLLRRRRTPFVHGADFYGLARAWTSGSAHSQVAKLRPVPVPAGVRYPGTYSNQVRSRCATAPASATQLRISELPACSLLRGRLFRKAASLSAQALRIARSNSSSTRKWLRPPDAATPTRASPEKL